jgi:fluoroacetyl-CoA thioesterase
MPGGSGGAYRTVMALAPGMGGSVTISVEEADTASAMRSGDVPVLATPRVVSLAEQATVECIADALEAGLTSVGTEVQLTHLAPCPIGAKVTADVVLESVEGRRLTFRVSVTDARGLVAVGRITRVVVKRSRFLERANG